MKLSERMFEEAQAAADVWGDKSPLATLPAEWAEEVTQMEIETADLTRENVELVRRLAEAETSTAAFRDLTQRSGAMRDEVGELVTRYDELVAWGHELETENRALSAMLRASARRTVDARWWRRRAEHNSSRRHGEAQRWLKTISHALGTPWGGVQQHTVDKMVEKAMFLRLQVKHRCHMPESGVYGMPFKREDVDRVIFTCMCGRNWGLVDITPLRWIEKSPPINDIPLDDEGYPIGV